MPFNSKKFAASLFKLALKYPKQEKRLAGQLISFCQRKNLTSRLPNILKHLEQAYERFQERECLTIASRDQLGPDTMEQIKRFVQAAPAAPIAVTADPNLHGGFVATYQNKVYDGSIKRQMARLKEKMVE